MTKSLQDCQFDGLLLEAWERCTEDEALRASPAYQCVRQLLCELTPCSARGHDELARLERAVCALRTGVYEDLCRLSCSEREVDAVVTRGDKRTEQQQLSPHAAAECSLKAALKAHGECTGLSRFFGEVATLTCDRGALLMRITDAVLSDFRTFADAVLGNRVAQIGSVLSREQLATRDRFFELSRRSMNRARLAVTYVRDAMPAFDWNRYASEPGYMRLVVKPSPGCVMRTDDVDDVDGARGKGLLYQLNWLRSEIDRAEAENRCLYEQHTGLATELADVNREISRAQTDAAERTQQMSRELDDLRARSAGQVCAIDRLMETIQMLQGLRDANASVDGACGKATENASGPPKMTTCRQP